MKETNEDIFLLAGKWRMELAGYRQEAERAKASHFEIYPDDAPDRVPTGDWMYWSDKAANLEARINDFEKALAATVPNRPLPEIERVPTHSELTEPRKKTLRRMIDDMQETVDRFYFMAIGLGNHPFVEWAGLMNEYVKMCHFALADGIDFTRCNIHSEQALPIHPVNTDYLAEKARCIFGKSI